MNIFLTGQKGVGKSTIIGRVLEDFISLSGGFLTWYSGGRKAPDRCCFFRPGKRPAGIAFRTNGKTNTKKILRGNPSEFNLSRKAKNLYYFYMGFRGCYQPFICFRRAKLIMPSCISPSLESIFPAP